MAHRGAEHQREGEGACQAVGGYLIQEQLEEPGVAALIGRTGIDRCVAVTHGLDSLGRHRITPAKEAWADVDQVQDNVGRRPGEPFGDKQRRLEGARFRLWIAANDRKSHAVRSSLPFWRIQ